MSLPNSVNAATPAGSDSPSTLDDQIRALKTFIEDLFGIPDNTSITQAAFDIDAGGLAQVIFYDAATTPASGELGRNGSPLYYRITDSRTNSVLRALGIIADTSGTPAAGIGTGILLQAESGDEAPSDVAGLDAIFTDVGAGTEDSVFAIALRVAGRALDEKYRFASTAGDGFGVTITHAVTADRTYTLPDETGTLMVSTAAGVVTRTAGDVTTASTSLVDLTGASITITTGARRVLLTFTCSCLNDTAGADLTFNFDIDGSLAFGSGGVIHESSETGGSEDNDFTMSFLTGVLSAGSHTFKVQWKVSAGNGTIRGNSTNSYHFAAIEQGATA